MMQISGVSEQTTPQVYEVLGQGGPGPRGFAIFQRWKSAILMMMMMMMMMLMLMLMLMAMTMTMMMMMMMVMLMMMMMMAMLMTMMMVMMMIMMKVNTGDDDDDDEEVFVGNPVINYHFGLPKLLQQHVEGFIYLFSDFLTWREGLLRDVFRL